MHPKRYDIYIADTKRPVVVVSQNAMNALLDTIVVCPLTSKTHPLWRSRVQVTCAGKKAEIVLDQIRTISKLRLHKKIDALSAQKADELRNIIHEMYAAA